MMAQQSRVPGLGARPLARDTGETGRAWGAAPPPRPALARSPASAWPSTEHRGQPTSYFGARRAWLGPSVSPGAGRGEEGRTFRTNVNFLHQIF